MTSKLFSIFLSVFVLAPSISFSNVCMESPGAKSCGEGTVDSVHAGGTLFLDKTTVQDKASVNGSGEIKGSKIKVLSVNGSVEVKETMVSDKATINGSIEAKESNFNDIFIHGSGKFDEVTVQGACEINGSLEAEETHFSKPIIFGGSTHSGKLATFEECTITQGIIVRSKSKKGNHVIIVLKEGTTVEGDITFEGGTGKVLMDTTTTFKGKVVGGTQEVTKELSKRLKEFFDDLF